MKKNHGFTLLELMLVIGISTVIAILSFQEKMLETEQMQAKQLGMELFQYNSAVQNYLAHESANPVPASIVGVRNGINWLKSTTCPTGNTGTASSDWLSCNFLTGNNQKTTFGKLSFTTQISYSATSGFSARTVMSKLTRGSPAQERADLSGLAVLIAKGAYSINGGGNPATAQDSTVVYCLDVAVPSPAVAATCGSDKGVIVMIARNQSSSDRWLRVDHGNVMQHSLEFRTNSITPASETDISAIDSVKRQIRNVARIYNLGDGNSNGESNNLILGKRNGNAAKAMSTLTNNAVIIDADQEILGQLKVRFDIKAEGSVTGGSLRSLGNAQIDKTLTVNENAIVMKDSHVYGYSTVDKTLTANENLTVMKDSHLYGYATIDKTLTANENLTVMKDARIYGSTTTNTLNAVNINGANLNGSNLTLSNNAIINGLVSAQYIVDANDSNYYIDPNNISKLNSLVTNNISSGNANINGRLNANEYLYIGGIANIGGSCSPNGLVGKQSNGDLVVCKNGVWQGNGNNMGFNAGRISLPWNTCTTLGVPPGYSRSSCRFYATVGSDTSDSNDYSINDITFDQTGRVCSSYSGDFITTNVNYFVICNSGW